MLSLPSDGPKPRNVTGTRGGFAVTYSDGDIPNP